MIPEKLASARLGISRQRPYISAALWAVHPVERPGLGTLAVDKWWRLYYDPVAVARWSVDELSGVLYHEIWHLLRGHAERAEAIQAEHLPWNLSADAEINDDILEEGIPLPGDAITPETLGCKRNLLAEEYYLELMKRKKESSSGQGGGEGQGEGEQDSGGGQEGRNQDSSQDSGGGQGQETKHPQTTRGSCGSCAHGHQEPWEEGEPGEGRTPGIGPAQAEAIRRTVAREIMEAVKSRGNVPTEHQRWAQAKLDPKVNWRRELAGAIRHAVASQSGAVDYTYTRPNRRQAAYGPVIMPSLHQPVPSVAVVVDTSGSMDDTEIGQALTEIKGILQSLGHREIRVLTVDAAVHTCQKVFRPEQISLVGGGGTDMRMGLQAALELKPKPQVVVIFTDGFTPWPDTAPRGVKVVVALVGKEVSKGPEWARVIRVED